MMRVLAIAACLLAGVVALAGGDRGGRLLLHWGMPSLAASMLSDPAWRGIALYQASRHDEALAALRATRSPEAAYNLGNALARTGDFKLAVKAYDLALRRDPDDGDARANRALVLALMNPHAPAVKGKAVSVASATATKESASENAAGDADGLQSSQGDGMAGTRESGASADKAGSSRVDRRGDAEAGISEQGVSSSKGAASDSAGRAGRGGGQTSLAKSDAPSPREPAPPPTMETAQATLQWLASLPDDPLRFLRARIAAEHQRRIEAGTAAPPGASPW
jgi:tetratricopeptide (TPR) repeat protein